MVPGDQFVVVNGEQLNESVLRVRDVFEAIRQGGEFLLGEQRGARQQGCGEGECDAFHGNSPVQQIF
jgi:hypothetical protein